MINKKLLSFFLLIVCFAAQAQVFDTVPMRHVLGTTGGSGVFSWGTVDYTVGEVMVTTDSVATSPFDFKWLTQGFQQPDDRTELLVKLIPSHSACIGANNGSVSFVVYTSTGPVKFSWNNSPNFDTVHTFSNLSPGVYDYKVKDPNFTISGTVRIIEDDIDCGKELGFYNGFTPNGDGHNDKWEIDGITNFKTSKVSIFNRWGDLVWSGENYDNNGNAWNGDNNHGIRLPDATYFYIIEAGGKVYKGWVELTH